MIRPDTPRAPLWRATWPALVITVATLVLFAPFVVGQRMFYWGTPLLQFMPWRAFAFEQMLAGQAPLWNPLVGGWSDRTQTRWGARRPWMLAGALILPVFFVAMFAAPSALPTSGAAVWTGFAFLVLGMSLFVTTEAVRAIGG